MADARENLQEAQGRRRRRSNGAEPSSSEETTLEIRPYERTDWRHETEPRSWEDKRAYDYLGSRINDAGPIRLHRDTYAQIRDHMHQQRLRDIEMERRKHETESRIQQQGRARTPDLDWGESERRLYERIQMRHNLAQSSLLASRRHETEPRSWAEKRGYDSSGLRVNEAGQIRGHREPYADIRETLQQPRLRDAGMQPWRSHETESRFMPQETTAITPYWGGIESERRHELVQSSVNPNRPGLRNCFDYLRNGWCSYGRNCIYNHPTHFPPYHKHDAFRYHHHSNDRDGAELSNARGLPMLEARTPEWGASGPTWRLDEGAQRRHETESRSVAGHKRARMEEEEEEELRDLGRQMREIQENLRKWTETRGKWLKKMCRDKD